MSDAGRNDQPPVGGTWARLYAAVLLALAAEVVLFYLFTKVVE